MQSHSPAFALTKRLSLASMKAEDEELDMRLQIGDWIKMSRAIEKRLTKARRSSHSSHSHWRQKFHLEVQLGGELS